MKKSLLLAMAVVLIASGANAAVLATDDFSYPDGSLVPNGGWATHSGTAGDLLVADGQAVVTHGVPSEDANLAFVAPETGLIYCAFDFSVDDLGHPYSNSNLDYEYFAHFMDAGFGFAARMDIVAPSGAGDFSVGLSANVSTADVTWPTDLTYGTVYRIVASYDRDLNIAQLWIDPTAPTDASIVSNLGGTGVAIQAFALRQSDSTENETIRVDNLVVATECEDSFEGCTVAVESVSFDSLKSLYR